MQGSDEQIIIDVVEEFIDANKMFTAWDVTVESRNKGLDRSIHHREIKRVVHSYPLPSSYARRTISIQNAPVDPWLYFPQSANPDDYNPGLKNIVAQAASLAIPLNTGNSILVPVYDDSTKLDLDKRGRYCVKAKDVKTAELEPGEDVYLQIVNDKIILTTVADPNYLVESSMVVEKDYNLRVFSSYFRKAMGHVPSNIEVEVFTGKIVITKA